MFNFDYKTVARIYEATKQSRIEYDKKVVELFECILNSGVKRCLEIGKVEYNQEDPDSLPTYTFKFDVKRKVSLTPDNSNDFVYEEVKKYLREKFGAIVENNNNAVIITLNHIDKWETDVAKPRGIQINYCESEILDGYKIILIFNPSNFHTNIHGTREDFS